MDEVKTLFLTRKGEGYVGAPQTFHEFEQAVGRIATCKWAGENWPLYKHGEPIRETVKRVMPDADWVMVDRDNTWEPPQSRRFKIGIFLSDLHGKYNMGVGSPEGFVNLINNAGFDAVFMKYMEVHGCRNVNPRLFQRALNCHTHFLPWSVDTVSHRWGDKNVDIAFMGSHQPRIYPLRSDMWNRLPSICGDHSMIRTLTPGGGTYGRRVAELKHRSYVGDRYVDALNRSKTLLFDSSIYRYPVQKYFEGSASGCILLCDEPSTAKELGFVDGETYVKVCVGDWTEKFLYCLEQYDDVRHIGEAARRNAVEKHTHKRRAEEFLRMLR